MQSCANEPCMVTTVLGIILQTVNMVSLSTSLLWGFAGSSQTCKHPLWWFTALHHFYLSLSQSFTHRLFAHAATLQVFPREHQWVTKSLTIISHLEPKRWFSRLCCLQCTVLLKNREAVNSLNNVYLFWNQTTLHKYLCLPSDPLVFKRGISERRMLSAMHYSLL